MEECCFRSVSKVHRPHGIVPAEPKRPPFHDAASAANTEVIEDLGVHVDQIEQRLERVEEALRWMVPRDDGMAPAPGEEDASSIQVSQRVDYLVQRLDTVEQATSKSISDLEHSLRSQRPERAETSSASLSRLENDVHAMVAAEVAKITSSSLLGADRPSGQHELLDARHRELQELTGDCHKMISALRLENETLREAVVASNAALTLSAAHIHRIQDANLGGGASSSRSASRGHVEALSSSGAAEDMRAIKQDLSSLCKGMDAAGGMLGVQGRSFTEASLTLSRPDANFPSSSGGQVESELKRVRSDLAKLVAWLQSAGDVLTDRGRTMIASSGDTKQGQASKRL